MNKLKELRTRYGMKQKDVAEKLGTTQQTIARWETGHTAIPVGHLRDLAVLFSSSVDELLGAVRRSDDDHAPHFAEAYGRPFGTGRFVFGFGQRDYPICHLAREILEVETEVIGLRETEGWLKFPALNNKLVFVNPDALQQFELITDDHEAMPEFHHPEVYHALAHEDAELGAATARQVKALREELGADGILKVVAMSEAVFLNGSSTHLVLDAKEAADGVSAIRRARKVPMNALAVLSTHGDDIKTIVNLSQVAVLEVPFERYLRLVRGS